MNFVFSISSQVYRLIFFIVDSSSWYACCCGVVESSAKILISAYLLTRSFSWTSWCCCHGVDSKVFSELLSRTCPINTRKRRVEDYSHFDSSRLEQQATLTYIFLRLHLRQDFTLDFQISSQSSFMNCSTNFECVKMIPTLDYHYPPPLSR